MPMPIYPLLCYTLDCNESAVYKISAHWSDGFTAELKTYALTCEGCLEGWFRQSLQRQRACRSSPSETLEPVGIFELARGALSHELERRTDLETQLLGDPTSTSPRGE